MTLTIKDLSFSYTNTVVLRGLSYDFPTSGLVVIEGANGSGKSTLLNILSGDLSPDEGEICIEGRRASSSALSDRVGRLYQTTVAPEDISASVLLSFVSGRREGISYFDRCAEFRPEPYVVHNKVFSLLAAIDVADKLDLPIAILSGGQKRGVMIAATLMLQRPIVILDEPLAGLSGAAQDAFVDLACYIAGQSLLLIVEHDPRVLYPHANEVVKLWEGRLVEGEDERN